MYPFGRMALEIWLHRNAPPLPLLGTHVSWHRCMPWDLDPWIELNNGRTLTLFDLGRIPLSLRTGLRAALRREGWGMTVAGSTVRYRRRIAMFDRVEMRSRCIGWDNRFLYTEQSLWRGADCTTQVVIRSAVTSAQGIVAPARVVAAMGEAADSPGLPPWVQAWIAAEAQRPWPPQR
jgi:acyl-CoA thioesterase FadM